jgi:hypothetical protein
MLDSCIEKRRNECSIFCDIDGVLLKHNDHSTSDSESNSTLPGHTQLKDLAAKNHRIILTTARNEKYRKEVEQLLRDKNIYYDDLLMSLPSGPRFLINDRKPSKLFTPQANAYEAKRDEGLQDFDVENVLRSNQEQIITDLSANSFAKTYLMEKNNKRFVRKHLFKTSDEKHYNVLKRQKNDLERFNFLVDGLCPQVYGECDSGLEYYYDMEYLPAYQILSDADEHLTKSKALESTLDILNTHIYSLSKPVVGTEWMRIFLNDKIYPKFDNFSMLNDEFRTIIESEKLLINGKENFGLRKIFDTLSYDKLSPANISVVHGDLTLENIMYNSETLDVKLIDMDGSRLFDAKELDLGKLSQSILSRYHLWKNAPGDKLVTDINLKRKAFVADDRYFINHDIEMSDALVDLWQPILQCSKHEVTRKAYFYMSTYFIRFVPFRMQLGKNHGVYALLMATTWLNKLISGD